MGFSLTVYNSSESLFWITDLDVEEYKKIRDFLPGEKTIGFFGSLIACSNR